MDARRLPPIVTIGRVILSPRLQILEPVWISAWWSGKAAQRGLDGAFPVRSASKMLGIHKGFLRFFP